MTASKRPNVVAVIPARGGSKGIPGKNLRLVGGRSLIERAVRASRAAASVDATFVSTDDPAIAAAARAAGGAIIDRPTDLAGDTASSESALRHALDQLATSDQPVDVLVFVQATSPFVDPADLDAAVAMVRDGAADSVFAGVETYEFLWRDADDSQTPGSGEVLGQNHDSSVRPRRQDRRPDFRETGAFYVMDAAGFRRAGHRFFGRTRVVGVAPLTALEIDEPADLILAEAVAGVVDLPDREPIDVDAVITDFDGVHTDDLVDVDSDGGETVRVSRSDGLGVARLRAAGIPLVIVSKERNPVVSARGAKLGVEVRQGIDDKQACVRELLAGARLDPARVAYLGNDVNDLPAMAAVGWPVAVPDAHPEVLRRARVVLSARGGQGAVRELCDRVLLARQGPA